MPCLFLYLNNYFDTQTAVLLHYRHVMHPRSSKKKKKKRQAKFPSIESSVCQSQTETKATSTGDSRNKKRSCNLSFLSATSLFSWELLGAYITPVQHCSWPLIDRWKHFEWHPPLQSMCPCGCETIIRKERSLQNSIFLVKEMTPELNFGINKTLILLALAL